MSVIPALGRKKQKEQEFKACLGYKDPVAKQQNNKRREVGKNEKLTT